MRAKSKWRAKRVLIVLGGTGLLLVGILIWWNAASSTAITIPTPTMPQPNAFDFSMKAADALVNMNAIGDAIYNRQTKAIRLYSFAEKQALLHQNAAALKLVRQGFAYDFRAPPVRSALDLSKTDTAKLRNIARLLVLEGQVKSLKGNNAGAVDSYLDALRLGVDAPRGAPLIGLLVGIAIQAIGRHYLWDSIDHLTAAEARAATRRLQEIMSRSVPFADTLIEEKWVSLSLQREQRRGMGKLSLLQRLIANERRLDHDCAQFMDALSANARQPYAGKIARPRLPLYPVTRILVQIIEGTVQHVYSNAINNETQNALLLTTLALRAYRAQHGVYPDHLDQLMPEYLQRVPADPFAVNAPLRYRKTKDKYLLYSIGPDAKDNGGEPIDKALSSNDTKSSDAKSSQRQRHHVLPDSQGDIVAGLNW